MDVKFQMHDTAVGRRLQTAASEEIFSLQTFVKDNRKSTSRKNGRSDPVSTREKTIIGIFYQDQRARSKANKTSSYRRCRGLLRLGRSVCLCVGSAMPLSKGTDRDRSIEGKVFSTDLGCVQGP